ncbi:hypothetical protein JI435_434540 [Parastagonospora nodorum SN15]|uniref:Secreted protein n=1 Tax=Phaeosphaeria nodorum (strain SN15 / ATCC MYA-4574 / FGSC 10173) TaxID=321614 RepID=A0A7U2HYY8_PHANO|nr:hypothetical protein JI435_434540 [Parastagonospora nodorum SN15]
MILAKTIMFRLMMRVAASTCSATNLHVYGMEVVCVCCLKIQEFGSTQATAADSAPIQIATSGFIPEPKRQFEYFHG